MYSMLSNHVIKGGVFDEVSITGHNLHACFDSNVRYNRTKSSVNWNTCPQFRFLGRWHNRCQMVNVFR